MPASLGLGHVKRESEKAFLIVLEELGEEKWIPKSVIHDDSEVWCPEGPNASGEVVVKEWWAEREGLV